MRVDSYVVECDQYPTTVDCVSHFSPYLGEISMKYLLYIPGTPTPRSRNAAYRSGISPVHLMPNSEIEDTSVSSQTFLQYVDDIQT